MLSPGLITGQLPGPYTPSPGLVRGAILTRKGRELAIARERLLRGEQYVWRVARYTDAYHRNLAIGYEASVAEAEARGAAERATHEVQRQAAAKSEERFALRNSQALTSRLVQAAHAGSSEGLGLRGAGRNLVSLPKNVPGGWLARAVTAAAPVAWASSLLPGGIRAISASVPSLWRRWFSPVRPVPLSAYKPVTRSPASRPALGTRRVTSAPPSTGTRTVTRKATSIPPPRSGTGTRATKYRPFTASAGPGTRVTKYRPFTASAGPGTGTTAYKPLTTRPGPTSTTAYKPLTARTGLGTGAITSALPPARVAAPARSFVPRGAFGKGLGILGIILGAKAVIDAVNQGHTEEARGILATGTGSVIGGVVGAGIGTFICPGLGTFVGGVVGSVVGGALGTAGMELDKGLPHAAGVFARATFDGVVGLPASMVGLVGGAAGLTSQGFELARDGLKSVGLNSLASYADVAAAGLKSAKDYVDGWAKYLTPSWSASSVWNSVKNWWNPSSTPQPAPSPPAEKQEAVEQANLLADINIDLNMIEASLQPQRTATNDAGRPGSSGEAQAKSYRSAFTDPPTPGAGGAEKKPVQTAAAAPAAPAAAPAPAGG
jgi:hypothetical protein